MFAAATIAVLIAMFMCLIRAFCGPSLFDRILAVNCFGTCTVLFIAILGFLTKRPDFMDVALLYTLINFIATIAVLKFCKYGDLGHAETAEEGEH
jgi:multicomponent Na+:H+ antiporter subunit F